jgi:hypothetical protein
LTHALRKSINVMPAQRETPSGGVKDSGDSCEIRVEGVDSYLVTRFISQGRPAIPSMESPCRNRRQGASKKFMA